METTCDSYVKRPESIIKLNCTFDLNTSTIEQNKKQQTYSCCTLFLSTDQCDVSSVTVFDSPQSTMVDKFDPHLCIS